MPKKNQNNPSSGWLNLGHSTTSPIDITQRKEVLVDEYYVVVGFEVNNKNAYKNNTQDLAIDYGHAFYYLVKNKLVEKYLSFGPATPGKRGWLNKGNENNKYNIGAIIKDGYKNKRPATGNYIITETVTGFKIPISIKQAIALKKYTDEFHQEILSGKQKYTAYLNDTCAETARDVLNQAGIETPDGFGYVKHSDLINWPIAYATNPYSWHAKFSQDKKYKKATDDDFPEQYLSLFLNKDDPLF